MAYVLPIYRTRGDTYRMRISFEEEGTGTPLDLTNCSLLMTVSSEEQPDDTTNQLFQLAGSIVAPATDGVADFEMSAAQADNLGELFYDVEITDVSGKTRTILEGPFTFSQDITKQQGQLGSWTYTFEGTKSEVVDPLDSGDWCYYPDATFIGNSPFYDVVDTTDVVLLEANYTAGGFPPTITFYQTNLFLTGADVLFDLTGSLELEALAYAGVTYSHIAHLGLANGCGSNRGVLNYFATRAIWKSGSGLNPAVLRNGPYARTGNDSWSYDLVGATVPEVAAWMRLKFRLERDTGYVRGKTWIDGSSEPAWQYEHQDAYLFEQPRMFPFFGVEADGNSFVALAEISVTQI
jgi:hypothetical protein